MEMNLKMKGCILKHAWLAAGVGVPGAFAAHADVPVLAGIWGKMIYNLAQHAGEPINQPTALKVGAVVAAAAGTMAVGVKAANTYFAYTGVGTLPAIFINATANGIGTWWVGQAAGKAITEKDPDKLAQSIIKALAFNLRPR